MELFSVDPVDCIADGPLACCDSKRGVMMLSATYDGQNGWVQMGELCKAPEIEALDFLPVPEEVSSLGDYCLMKVADANGLHGCLSTRRRRTAPYGTIA